MQFFDTWKTNSHVSFWPIKGARVTHRVEHAGVWTSPAGHPLSTHGRAHSVQRPCSVPGNAGQTASSCSAGPEQLRQQCKGPCMGFRGCHQGQGIQWGQLGMEAALPVRAGAPGLGCPLYSKSGRTGCLPRTPAFPIAYLRVFHSVLQAGCPHHHRTQRFVAKGINVSLHTIESCPGQ